MKTGSGRRERWRVIGAHLNDQDFATAEWQTETTDTLACPFPSDPADRLVPDGAVGMETIHCPPPDQQRERQAVQERGRWLWAN